MRRATVGLCVVLALVAAQAPLGAQAPPSDPELAAGVRQVEEGDFEAAVLTLDGVARRLSKEKGRSQDLARAYLYLGIAYLGLGQETTAKAKFLDTLSQARDMTLDPAQFPPNVIKAFNDAKQAAAKPVPTPEPAKPPQISTPPQSTKGGGGKKLLVLGVVGAAAAGGAVLALGGGDVTDTFRGTLSPGQLVQHSFTMSKEGVIQARMDSVSPSGADIDIWICIGSLGNCPVNNVDQKTPTPVSLSLAAGSYIAVADSDDFRPITYVLKVTHPK